MGTPVREGRKSDLVIWTVVLAAAVAGGAVLNSCRNKKPHPQLDRDLEAAAGLAIA